MGDGLYKRGKIWWIRTDPLDRCERSTKCRDVQAARAVLRERERLAADPDYAAEEAPCHTIAEWIARFLEEKKAMRAGGTYDFYVQKLGHIARIFGPNAAITVLTPRRFDGYVKKRMEEEARPTTIIKEINAAKTLANSAKRLGAFRGDTKLFKPSSLDNDYEPGERFLLPEDLPKLLPELSDKRGAHIALSIALGPRFSESFRILPSHVKHTPATESAPEQFLVFIPGTKTKKSKDTIPVAEPFHPLLKAALPFLPLAAWTNMTRDLDAACVRAKIPKLTSNDLRRTNASWLGEAGVPDSMVSRLLRHVDERMVRRVYNRVRPEKLALTLSAQLASATNTRQLPAATAREASSAPEKPRETDCCEEKARGLKILVSAVQFRPGTPGKNTANGEIAGGSAIGDECQDVSQGDGNSQNLPDRNATIDPEAAEFADALREQTEHDRVRAGLSGADRPEATATEPQIEPMVHGAVVAGTLRVPAAPSKNQKAGGYRGVRWNEKAKRWQATVGGGEKKADGRRRQIHLGFFDSDVEAALHYDVAATKAFGPGARLNFPHAAARPPAKARPYIARKRVARGGDS